MDNSLTRAISFLAGFQSDCRNDPEILWRIRRVLFEVYPGLPLNPNPPALVLWIWEPSVGRFVFSIPKGALDVMGSDLAGELVSKVQEHVRKLQTRGYSSPSVETDTGEGEA